MAIIAAGRKIGPRVVLGNLAAFGAGVVVTLSIAELVLRLLGIGQPYYSAPELYRPDPDPRVLFEPRPHFDGFSEGTSVQTNSLGLRDRDLGTKPPDVVRLLFLGDSVTFGSGVPNDRPFPRLLEASLSDLPARRVETVNAGVVGYNTTQQLARLERIGPRYMPDVVILTFVVNDLLDAFSIFDHQYDPIGVLAAPKVWLRRNSHLYRFAQDTYWRVALEARRTRTAPAESTRSRARVEERLAEVGAVAETAKAHGAAFFLVLYPDNLDDGVGPDAAGERSTVRQELVRAATQAGYPVLDLTAALGDVRDPRAREFRLREDPHPSPIGHQAIAEALSSPLRSLVADVRAGR